MIHFCFLSLETVFYGEKCRTCIHHHWAGLVASKSSLLEGPLISSEGGGEVQHQQIAAGGASPHRQRTQGSASAQSVRLYYRFCCYRVLSWRTLTPDLFSKAAPNPSPNSCTVALPYTMRERSEEQVNAFLFFFLLSIFFHQEIKKEKKRAQAKKVEIKKILLEIKKKIIHIIHSNLLVIYYHTNDCSNTKRAGCFKQHSVHL